ncbi:auxin-repressed 12.5 kDa protein isoform X2 [Beta vulgaris subsp. vulgaris]|uniref:auxin-repressed 12.5 kDa protein isoform X2 n=1 Tax=Beta vulgaris subsp. vulgaris TaxID=3555 RepID=UPI002036F92E|nr:auxin-repressed 12.5 kDa protein isoform X2 [Beta vulgaris subsp. vulgaris]
MVLLEKLWDDVLAARHPDRGLDKLKKLQTNLATTPEGDMAKYQRSVSMPPSSGSTSAIPASPTSPGTPTTPSSARSRDNVWRSVFHPGSNLNTRNIGNQIFDKPTQASSPTVYDWLYSGETRSKHHVK